MALTKRTFLDQVVIDVPTGTVAWRETTVIEEGGIELSRTFMRTSREADDDKNPVPAEVAAYRALAVTPAKIAAAKARREEVVTRIQQSKPKTQ